MRVAHSTIFCLLFSFRRGAAFFNKNGRPLDVVTSKLAPVFDFQLFPTEDRRLIIGHLAPHWAVWIAVKVTKKSIENLSFFCLFILFPRKLHGGEARSIFNCLEDERCSRQFGRKKKRYVPKPHSSGARRECWAEATKARNRGPAPRGEHPARAESTPEPCRVGGDVSRAADISVALQQQHNTHVKQVTHSTCRQKEVRLQKTSPLIATR